MPIKDELQALFPTLLAGGAEGMQQLEIKVDAENGKILRSDTPVRVSLIYLTDLIADVVAVYPVF